jgi:DNA mismatch repair protein MutL
MPIQRLPTSVINKIAAGEVIERPASVVKELCENSLDAGATHVDVSIEQGGLDLVRVADDGGGIPREELSLAVAPHATSKLQDADDLFRVGTLGFRGEALASIAEISRFSLRSRQPGSEGGWELEVVGGEAAEPVPCGMSPGTTIEVRNLFYNTPVRRKFQRTTQTELGHVSEQFTRLALAYPHVRFTLRHNDRTLYDLPANQDLPTRIGAFFGEDLVRDLLPIAGRDGETKLSGYVARPSQSRSHQKMQYLFLNGRFIRDRSLQHALAEAYRGLLLTGRYPICFLHLELPADAVDVNVHPTKMEVRFLDGGRIYGQLLAALRTKFLATDLTHKLDGSGAQAPAALNAAPVVDENDPAAAVDPGQAARVRQDFVRWAQGAATPAHDPAPWDRDDAALASPAATIASPPSRPLTTHGVPAFRPFSDHGSSPFARPLPQPTIVDVQPVELGPPANAPTAAPFAPPLPADECDPIRAIQVHNRYLIAESEEGVLVIDQHALHERILYEQLRDKIGRGSLETQTLLVPEPVDLAPPEAAAVLERRETLAKIGLLVEPFGGGTVLVSGYPAMLSKFPAAEILRSIADQVLVDGKTPEHRDLMDDLLNMIACKAAVKAGDRLTPDEVTALVADRRLARDTHHCPHGRPTSLVFTREELDKQFKRT